MENPLDPSNRVQPKHLFLVIGSILLITVLHYSTMKTRIHYHVFYRELYFVPILFMSYAYGMRRGLLTSIFVALLYLPHVLMTWEAQPAVNLGNLFGILVFILVAVTIGYLSDREKERQRQIGKAESLASLGRASLTMAGELQTLLKTLKESLRSTSVGHECRDNVRKVIDKVTVIEQNLSQFSPEYLEQSREFIEVNTYMGEVRKRILKLASERGISVEMDLDTPGCIVQINELDFMWVLEQLLKNAIENSQHGTKVRVFSTCTEGHCLISVQDQGTGIAAENQSKVFAPFFTTKERGTGLGLAVCKKIMKDNGGDIQLQSEPGKGSTFTLSFPMPLFEGKNSESRPTRP